jgi:hypothetical protein
VFVPLCCKVSHLHTRTQLQEILVKTVHIFAFRPVRDHHNGEIFDGVNPPDDGLLAVETDGGSQFLLT